MASTTLLLTPETVADEAVAAVDVEDVASSVETVDVVVLAAVATLEEALAVTVADLAAAALSTSRTNPRSLLSVPKGNLYYMRSRLRSESGVSRTKLMARLSALTC